MVDRNCGRKPLNRIDIGFIHLAEELARIAGKTLDIPALPIRVDGVKGETGFAAAGKAGHDDQLVPRQFQINIL